jgi:glycolate oxidase iron-sulfur subunit
MSTETKESPKTPSTSAADYIKHDLLMDCVHCGLCLSDCPTYAENGDEADSPRGRIYLMRSMVEGRAEATPSLVEHLDLCLGCRGCETACPSGVQYGQLIEQTRNYLHDNYQRPPQPKLKTKLVETFFPYPNRMELALAPVRILRRTKVLSLLRKLGIMQKFPQLNDMEQLLPPLPPMKTRLQFAEDWPAQKEELARVGMITGCVMQVMQSDVNVATAKVLSRAGCRVIAPKTQNCCGALHAHVGDMEQARLFARQNIVVFEEWEKQNGPLDAIVINAAGCGAALKEYYHWFEGDEEWEKRAEAFAHKVKDVSEFLAEEPYVNRLEELMKMNAAGMHSLGRVTYHDACHLAHGQSIREQPRQLLQLLEKYVPDMEIVPLGESELCCGSAGSYNITQPKMAMQLLNRKLDHVEESTADVVVTGNPGCMMQIRLGTLKRDLPIEVLHPVELLDRATT